MGISVALTPSTTTVTTVSKSMITNASFRTKKLPGKSSFQFLAISSCDFSKRFASISFILHHIVRFMCEYFPIITKIPFSLSQNNYALAGHAHEKVFAGF
jgi:Hyccin